MSDANPATRRLDRLSPSRAKEFDQCPRRFWFGTVRGCSSPPTSATLKGNLFHSVFEQLYGLPREERGREPALELVEPAWSAMVEPDIGEASERELASSQEARFVIPAGSEAESLLLAETIQLIENYFDAEIERWWNFDPAGIELHLEAELGSLTLHGFLDRLDRYETAAGEERWVISDYKTGKLPKARFIDEAFFAMRLYALLLSETRGLTAHSLRLIFPGAPTRKEAIISCAVDETMLAATRE